MQEYIYMISTTVFVFAEKCLLIILIRLRGSQSRRIVLDVDLKGYWLEGTAYHEDHQVRADGVVQKEGLVPSDETKQRSGSKYIDRLYIELNIKGCLY